MLTILICQVALRDEIDNSAVQENGGGDDKLLKDEEITEDLIWAGIQKIKLIYDRSDENSEVKIGNRIS